MATATRGQEGAVGSSRRSVTPADATLIDGDLVVATTAVDEVALAVVGHDDVVATAGEDDVSAETGVDRVVATTAMAAVAAGVPEDLIVAIAAREPVAGRCLASRLRQGIIAPRRHWRAWAG
jgi:hypothetical protein